MWIALRPYTGVAPQYSVLMSKYSTVLVRYGEGNPRIMCNKRGGGDFCINLVTNRRINGNVYENEVERWIKFGLEKDEMLSGSLKKHSIST